MTQNYRVSILGDGGWGTALAIVNARRKNEVLLWSAFSDYAKILEEKRENPKFLPGVSLAREIKITASLKDALAFGDLIVLAIPTQYLRNILFKIKEHSFAGKTFVSVAKGIEKKTGLRPSEIIRSILGKAVPVVVLSGPSHAEEVSRGIPTLVVAASDTRDEALKVQAAFRDTCFRVYAQTDIVGVELGGALKNVIAIAAGISDGLKFGDNTKSGLITRGLLEMTRLGVKLGASPNTSFGLSGLGDLITTCFSKHGRNLRVGREIGEGKKIEEILKGMEMVAEGVATSESVHELSKKLNVSTPIMEQVYQILFQGKDARQGVMDLLDRVPGEEWKPH